MRKDGTVLKQQVAMFGSTISFARLGDEEAVALEERVNKEGRPALIPTLP